MRSEISRGLEKVLASRRSLLLVFVKSLALATLSAEYNGTSTAEVPSGSRAVRHAICCRHAMATRRGCSLDVLTSFMPCSSVPAENMGENDNDVDTAPVCFVLQGRPREHVEGGQVLRRNRAKVLAGDAARSGMYGNKFIAGVGRVTNRARSYKIGGRLVPAAGGGSKTVWGEGDDARIDAAYPTKESPKPSPCVVQVLVLKCLSLLLFLSPNISGSLPSSFPTVANAVVLFLWPLYHKRHSHVVLCPG